MEHVRNLDPASCLPVMDQILSCREASDTRCDLLTRPPTTGISSQQPEPLHHRVDQSVGDREAGPLRPIDKDLIQIPFGILGDAAGVSCFRRSLSEELSPARFHARRKLRQALTVHVPGKLPPLDCRKPGPYALVESRLSHPPSARSEYRPQAIAPGALPAPLPPACV
jgi:hypothetical protein